LQSPRMAAATCPSACHCRRQPCCMAAGIWLHALLHRVNYCAPKVLHQLDIVANNLQAQHSNHQHTAVKPFHQYHAMLPAVREQPRGLLRSASYEQQSAHLSDAQSSTGRKQAPVQLG
jgi:hypothetical protein